VKVTKLELILIMSLVRQVDAMNNIINQSCVYVIRRLWYSLWYTLMSNCK